MRFCSPHGISERALRLPGLLWGTHVPLDPPTPDPKARLIALGCNSKQPNPNPNLTVCFLMWATGM